MKTREFKRSQLIEWELPYLYAGYKYDDGFEILEHKQTGSDRWSIHHTAVFIPPGEGQAYRVWWSVGATELQDERPWEGEENVTATLVYPHEVTVIEWRSEDE